MKKYYAWSGVVGPLLIGLGIIISILAYSGSQGQSYNLMNHFVSELGEIEVSDLAAVFNGGLILGGIFNLIFMIYLASQFPGWIRYPLAIMGAATALCGTLIGVFPMNDLDRHLFVALGFFNLGLLVSLIYSLIFLFKKDHPFPRWLAVPGLLNTAAFFIFNNFPPQFEEGIEFQDGMAGLFSNRPAFIPLAMMEWIVILGILIWFLILGIYLTRSARSKNDRTAHSPDPLPE